MENNNVSKAQSYFELINNGQFNTQAFADLFTEDVEIYYPKFGYAKGMEGIGSFSQHVRKLINDLHFEMDKFTYITNEKYVIVEGSEKGITRTGIPFPDGIVSHGKFCTVFEFENSRIKRMHCYVDPDFGGEDIERAQLLNTTIEASQKEDIETQTRNVVNNFYDIQFGRTEGNLEDLFADEIDWDLPGNTEKFEWVGKRTKKNQVGEFFKLLYANVKPEKFEIDFIAVKGENATVVGELSSKILKYDKVFTTEFVVIFKVVNGKIVKFHLLEDGYKLNEEMN
ncbi:nuclear transport factor 2 family protein [Chryseobacterium polytrichastri]|uniref:Ketosteroid isomerase-related protein n=1 Tax=Chryseobacterium polytrichastri TaxID=1302687 RepID=A0A1M6XID5_9FLAO|nr:nuclear transport factor 2 family protein [Chryseobacterium polytrichastri]SHL05737.1 Ketosteroid isomerase-related protein [Chryseobacterium polytrichastri]